MKKVFVKYAATAIVAAAFTGCIADEPFYNYGEGEGTLYLSTKINSDVQVSSRAEVEGLAETCDIWIANDKGVVRKYNGIGEVPSDGIKLVTGNYKVMVWAGDSLPASWNERFFKGTELFSIEPNDKKAVTVTGKIANSVVAVNFDSTVGDVLTDYSLTVGHSQGKLVYDADTDIDARGYFMMNSRDKDLVWTLSGTRLDGSEYTRSGSIVGAQPTTLYTLNVLCTENNEEFGGAYLDVVVDESTLDKTFDIEIDAAPEIKGIDFNINQPQRAEQYNMGKKSVWITTTSAIANLDLECDYFEQLFDGFNGFDLITMTDEGLRRQIEEAGITYVLSDNNQEDGSVLPTVKLNFTKAFTDNLREGEYDIRIFVKDIKGKQASATLQLVISDAPFSVVVPDDNDVWATHAKVSVSIDKEGEWQPVVKYRKKGSSSWENSIETSPSSKGSTVTVELTDLDPGTTYEFCASQNDFESSVAEFVTEVAAQLPNNSFENWNTSTKAYLIYENGGEMFWDSGNHGSTTLGSQWNITVPETSKVHNGSKAISLNSKYVIAKFAAGNVFAGEYLDTDGTDGVLGWGRPFTSRPKQLKVWAHYKYSNINRRANDAPDEYVSGQPDRGIIYVALLDDYTETYNRKNYPVIIKTKASSRRLFNAYGSDKPHVIAYGEHIFDASSPATHNSSDGDLVEITIDLDYDTFGRNIRPTYILLTASASKGGDYFTGGDSSVLTLDDIELVY